MLVVATRCEEDYYNMEIYVYEEDEHEVDEEDEDAGTRGNIFIHHDVMLPDFALASVWTGVDPTVEAATRGNFVAVATAAPMIEIWNLGAYVASPRACRRSLT
jgi:periodic tryptophan protein 1